MMRKTRKTSLCMIVGMCVILAMALTACGQAGTTKEAKEMTPTQTVETFLDAFKAQDEEAMNQVYAGKGNDFMSAYEDDASEGMDSSIKDAMMEKFYDFDYEVTGEEISEDGKTATVDLTVTTYDMMAVFNDFYQDFMGQALEQFSGNANNASQEDYEKMAIEILQEKLAAATEKDYTGDAKLNLTKKDGQWVVNKIGEDNEDFLNAITGGLMDVLKDVVNTRGGAEGGDGGNAEGGDGGDAEGGDGGNAEGSDGGDAEGSDAGSGENEEND